MVYVRKNIGDIFKAQILLGYFNYSCHEHYKGHFERRGYDMESVNGRLNENDLEFIETLRDLGVSRNLATLIAYLAGLKEASSKEIEIGAKLSQAGVSNAVKTLREKGWVEERKIKGGKKGRLMNVYSLRVDMEEIIRHFEREKLNESAQVMISIQRLKELAST
jgi:predicted transcriptional regulator